MRIHRILGLVLVGGALVACQDLDVANPNSPALEESLATPTNVETTVGSAFKYWHGQTMDDDTRQGVSAWQTVALAGNADELTDFVGTGGFDIVAIEPKQPIEHRDAGFWFNRTPWANYHTAIAMCNDVIATLDKGMKLGQIDEAYPNGRNTDRARWFCEFVAGASHAYISALYDRGFILEPNVERDIYSTDFKTPAEVHAYAITRIEKAIALAKAAPADDTPVSWVNGQSYTRDEFVRVMHSYLARIRAFSARNITERAAVNWTKVISDIDNGITDNFHPITGNLLAGRSQLCPTAGQPCGGAFLVTSNRDIRGTRHAYRLWISTTASSNPRISQRFLGPGDTTGAWQWWEAQNLGTRKDTIYGSPDKRIHLTTGTSAGRYFARGGAPAANLGPVTYSRYIFQRLGPFGQNGYRDSVNTTLTRTEMDLLKAEGLIRLGRSAEAVPLINKTRVGVAGTAAGSYGGNLPPVTIAGPPQATAADRASCVPRKTDGTCGNLMDALMWEKRLEMVGTDPIINWSDWRAWGKFQPGTWLHMPIHSRELFTLGIPYYTFGGTLPGSVGAPGTDYTRVP